MKGRWGSTRSQGFGWTVHSLRLQGSGSGLGFEGIRFPPWWFQPLAQGLWFRVGPGCLGFGRKVCCPDLNSKQQ